MPRPAKVAAASGFLRHIELCPSPTFRYYCGFSQKGQSATIGPLEPQKAPAYFNDALCDAERLLKYAAEIGIDVTADTRGAILRARTASTEGWPEQTAADLLA